LYHRKSSCELSRKKVLKEKKGEDISFKRYLKLLGRGKVLSLTYREGNGILLTVPGEGFGETEEGGKRRGIS